MSDRDLHSMFITDDPEPMTDVVRQIVDDPGTSHWLRLALQDAMQRDPVDAANDADTLASVLTMRAELVLRKGMGLRRPSKS